LCQLKSFKNASGSLSLRESSFFGSSVTASVATSTTSSLTSFFGAAFFVAFCALF
jgi:hypothetical protein